MKKDYDLSTRCVHAGESGDAEGSPHTPIYNATKYLGGHSDLIEDLNSALENVG